MRRSEKEVTARAEIDAIIRRSQVFRLGLSDEGRPYVVPLCFGYDGTALYFHCAREGRKLEILRRNNRVCLEFDVVEGLSEAPEACGWGTRFESVIAWGAPRLIEDPAEKRDALDLIMSHYAGVRSDSPWTYDESTLARTVVVRIPLETVTAKARD